MNPPLPRGTCWICSRPAGRAVRCPWCDEPVPIPAGTFPGIVLCALAAVLAAAAAAIAPHRLPGGPGFPSAGLSLLPAPEPHLAWISGLILLFLGLRPRPGPHWLQNDIRRQTHRREACLSLGVLMTFGALGLTGGMLASREISSRWNPFPLTIFLGMLGVHVFSRTNKTVRTLKRLAAVALCLLAGRSLGGSGMLYLAACATAFQGAERLDPDPRMPLAAILLPLALGAPGLVHLSG